MREFRVKILSLEDEAARLNGLLGGGWPLGTEGSRRLAEDAAHAAAHPEAFEDDDDDDWEDAQRPRHFEDDDDWEDDGDLEDDDDDDWEDTDEEQEGEGGFGRRALTFEEAPQETRC